ncbi:large conductance mechanosensitive channel protein [Megasphaera paucivorans]|uniref:Large conductance mechanosensitive channel protein n=1 Tax=Megasphaera paucivorans TaxID=349095 RepID=A0A1G9ZIY6_9FIRM|nr:large conductance mechanosensitive channel protein [Megasphaera paucivorans]
MNDFLSEFKRFIMRGNVLDMAIGVVVEAAFSKIVSSLVTYIIMPPLGVLLGGIDFSNFFILLSTTKRAETLAEA